MEILKNFKYKHYVDELAQNVFAHPRCEKEVNVLVKQALVLVIAEAEVLQKVVRQSHHLVHAHIFLLEWNSANTL